MVSLKIQKSTEYFLWLLYIDLLILHNDVIFLYFFTSFNHVVTFTIKYHYQILEQLQNPSDKHFLILFQTKTANRNANTANEKRPVGVAQGYSI